MEVGVPSSAAQGTGSLYPAGAVFGPEDVAYVVFAKVEGEEGRVPLTGPKSRKEADETLERILKNEQPYLVLTAHGTSYHIHR